MVAGSDLHVTRTGAALPTRAATEWRRGTTAEPLGRAWRCDALNFIEQAARQRTGNAAPADGIEPLTECNAVLDNIGWRISVPLPRHVFTEDVKRAGILGGDDAPGPAGDLFKPQSPTIIEFPTSRQLPLPRTPPANRGHRRTVLDAPQSNLSDLRILNVQTLTRNGQIMDLPPLI